MLKNFNDLIKKINRQEKKKIVIAMAQDKDVILAVDQAQTEGLTDPIFVGSKEKIIKIAQDNNINLSKYEIIDNEDEISCIKESVNLVKNDYANVLMKGLCSTANFIRGILDKENGLRSGKLLSHLAIFESSNYKKLLFLSDAALNIAPDLKEKITITENAINALIKLGYKEPRVAILSAAEKVNDSMQSSMDAAIISKMGQRKQITNALIDGPLAVDNALSPMINKIKGLDSPLNGEADICIVPNIEAGNVFYKVLTVLGNAKVAGILLGASAPIVLPSRADSKSAKYLSIVSALALS